MRQQTWFASVVCALAVMPGFALGGLFKMFLYVFGGWTEGADFLYLRAIFGIETPGLVYDTNGHNYGNYHLDIVGASNGYR